MDVCVCVCVRVCGVGGGERDLLPLMYEKLRFITSDFLYNLVLEMEYPNWRQRIFGLSYHKGGRRGNHLIQIIFAGLDYQKGEKMGELSNPHNYW